MKSLLVWMILFVTIPSGWSQTYGHGGFSDRTVKFNFNSDHEFILVKVRLANVLPLNFIFDTGSEHTILFKKEYADLLGFEYDRKIPLYGADLSEQIYAYIARGVDLSIEGGPDFFSDLLVMEADYLQLQEFTGINIDGILGANLFRHLVLEINNRKKEITLMPPSKFKPPKRHEVLPIEIQQNKPYLTTTAKLAGEEISLKLLLDTGASLPLLLYTRTHPKLVLPEETILGNLGMGLGGFLQGYVGRVDHLDFADFRYDNLITSFQEFEFDSIITTRTDRNGIIGNSMLGRYNVAIDYQRSKLYLKPNRKFKRKFRYDKSGLVIVAAGADLKNFIIQTVNEGSPAAEADLRRGDLIRNVKGIPSSFYTLAGINSLLSGKQGKRIRMIVLRNGKKLKKTITLRERI